MATRWQDVAAQQAEVAADHLRDLMTATLGLLHSRFGLNLGIEPKQYQSWVLLLTAVLGLLVIVAVWVAACAGIIARSKRASSSRQAAVASSESKLTSSRGQRVDDLKKKQKKKPTDKIKVNGRIEMPEDDLISFIQKEPLKQPLESEKKTEKQVKNKKKKQKSDQKQGHETSPPDKKEADEGAWEKKVSNREKRQQRKREKAVDPGFDSNIEVATVVATEQVLSTIHVSSAPRKNRGEQSLNNQFSVVKSGKDDAVISQVSAGWNETPSVNGGSWSEIPGKRQTQIVCEDKWPSVQPATTGKKKMETCTWNSDAGDDSGTTADWSGSLRAKPWGQHTLFPPIDSWSNVDGRMNSSEQGSGSFPSLGLGPPLPGATEPSTQPVVPDHQWDTALAPVEDEWSGLNGLPSADPSSDWNAPSEEWGHWVEEEAATSPQIEEPVTTEVQKISDDEKEKVESTQHGSSSGKSKKKKKKKKKQGDDSSSATQEMEPEREVLTEIPECSVEVVSKEMHLPVQNVGSIDAEEEPEEEANPAVVIKDMLDTISRSHPQKTISQVPQRPSEPEASITTKQNSVPLPSLQTKSEDLDSMKQVRKKKKARRET